MYLYIIQKQQTNEIMSKIQNYINPSLVSSLQVQKTKEGYLVVINLSGGTQKTIGFYDLESKDNFVKQFKLIKL